MPDLSLYLPKHASLTIKVGDAVTFGQELGKAFSSAPIVYDLAKLLTIRKPQTAQLAKLVLKKEGDSVEKGEVLARKRSFFTTKILRAAFSGKIVGLDLSAGTLTLLPQQVESAQIVAPVDGVTKAIDNEGIVISYKGVLVFAKKGIGAMRKGKLCILSKPTEEVTLSQISKEHSGTVVLGGSFASAVLAKAFGIGAASVIATSINEEDFAYFEGKNVFDPSLVLVSSADYSTIKDYEGKDVVVEGQHKRILINL